MAAEYSCRTLTGNWYEQRLADVPRPESISVANTRQDRLIRLSEPATVRTQTVDFPKSSDSPFEAAETISSCITTKQDMEEHLSDTVHALQKPMMVNQHNLREVFKKPRVIDRPDTGFGALLPGVNEQPHVEMLTTNQHFYSKLPAEAPPSIHAEKTSRRHCSAGKLYKDSHTTDKAPMLPSGRCGQRGELTRHPGEAGSMYGISTFVDEYATWGTQFLGQKRGDV